MKKHLLTLALALCACMATYAYETDPNPQPYPVSGVILTDCQTIIPVRGPETFGSTLESIIYYDNLANQSCGSTGTNWTYTPFPSPSSSPGQDAKK